MALNIHYANLPKRQRMAVLHPFTLPEGASGPTTVDNFDLGLSAVALARLCDGCDQIFNARRVCKPAKMDSLSVEIRISV